jgi:hypothetical protein
MRTAKTGVRRSFPYLALPALVWLSACAGEPVPTTQLALAKQAVDEATRSGAATRDPQDLLSAREKLARADQAAGSENTVARRLAEEAQADAQLAAARSRTAAATAVLNQAQQGNATLQQEMQRKNNAQ